jgi:hypothetical protein
MRMLIVKRDIVLVLALIVAAFAGGMGVACDYQGENPTNRQGLTYTEDMGIYCSFDCTDDDWCFKTNFPECFALICVGQQDDNYCSNFCLNQNDCPDGYTCLEYCDANSSEPYCVKDKDHEYLVGIGKCTE